MVSWYLRTQSSKSFSLFFSNIKQDWLNWSKIWRNEMVSHTYPNFIGKLSSLYKFEYFLFFIIKYNVYIVLGEGLTLNMASTVHKAVDTASHLMWNPVFSNITQIPLGDYYKPHLFLVFANWMNSFKNSLATRSTYWVVLL